MTELPQWAVERADDLCAQILERATNTDYGIGVSLDSRDLIARALADAAKPKWQPIETAPKDGSEFLATGWDYNNVGGNRHYAHAKWDDDQLGFFEVGVGDGRLGFLTHWLPLPDAPEVG